jgi:hypothetical protein
MGSWTAVGGTKRIVVYMAGAAVLSFLLRAVGVGVLLPLLMPIPILAMTYYSMKGNQPATCPTCGLRLSYRPLGQGRGMLECPALCGYRKMVERGQRRS